MRVAVVGAYGAGKSTLAARFAEQAGLPVAHGTPMRDPAGGPPKPLADADPAELIQLVVRRYAERVEAEARNPQGFVSDGSLLHEWVYATVRLAVGTHPAAGVDLALANDAGDPHAEVVAALGREIVQRAAQSYDRVVHLPVEFALTDVVKPISEPFRDLSDELMMRTFAVAGVTVHPITGAVDARLSALADLVSKT